MRKRGMEKKAQVTIFIIIAIVVVILIGLLFFFMRGSTTSNINSEQSKLELVNPQVRPVYLYIDDYAKDVIEEGLEILRLQGGYIYFPIGTKLAEIQTSGKHVRNENNNPQLIDGSGRTMAPLWTDKDNMAVPSLRFMADQLELYVQDKLKDLSFTEFESQGMEISQEDLDVAVFLSDEVQVLFYLPTEINFKEQIFTFEEFEQTVLINFNELYDTISALVIYELSYNYLENHAKSLISLYSYAGGEKRERSLPPFHFTDTNTDGKFVTWNPTEVKQDLNSIFADNYKFLKMDKTNFKRIETSDKMAQGVYDSFIYDYFPENQDIHIDFSYNPNNNMEFRTYPANLIPERNSQTKIPFLPSFTTFKYDFEYTVAAPIIVKVKNDNSGMFSPEGYEFYFPLDVYICNNLERDCAEIIEYDLDMDMIGKELNTKFYDCDDMESETTFITTDLDSGEDLGGVDITHYCEGFTNNCWLGQTGINSRGLYVRLPKCENSTIELTKNGYQTLLEEVKTNYALERTKDYNLEVMLVRANDFAAAYYLTNGFTTDSCEKTKEAYLESSLFMPNEKDQVMLTISNTNGANSAFALYPTDEQIAFAGGQYKVNTIVQSEVEIQPSYFAGEYVSFNTEDNEAPYEGDWVMGASENEFNINPLELQGRDTIMFYVFVEHLSTEELTVENMQSVLVSPTGITGEIQADSDCDGVDETITVNIPKSNYNSFIKPRFTKKI
jgi:hypothetical protein